jgi:hypothetical protein
MEGATLAMLYPGQALALRRAVALQLIRGDDAWHVLPSLKQLVEKRLRGLLIAPALAQDIVHLQTPWLMISPGKRWFL